MFDVGFSELLIIAVVALLVLGPERLPKAARFAGLWVRKARAQWYSVKSELELELAQEEMKQHLQSVENSIKAPMQELQNDLQDAQNEINNGFVDAGRNEVQTAIPPPAPAPDVEEQAPAAETPALPDTADEQLASDDGADETQPKQGALW
jgi:sec-independent protein translocase protein TatB